MPGALSTAGGQAARRAHATVGTRGEQSRATWPNSAHVPGHMALAGHSSEHSAHSGALPAAHRPHLGQGRKRSGPHRRFPVSAGTAAAPGPAGQQSIRHKPRRLRRASSAAAHRQTAQALLARSTVPAVTEQPGNNRACSSPGARTCIRLSIDPLVASSAAQPSHRRRMDRAEAEEASASVR